MESMLRTWVDERALSLAAGDALSLAAGDALSLAAGDALSLAAGEALSLAAGDALSLSAGVGAGGEIMPITRPLHTSLFVPSTRAMSHCPASTSALYSVTASSLTSASVQTVFPGIENLI